MYSFFWLFGLGFSFLFLFLFFVVLEYVVVYPHGVLGTAKAVQGHRLGLTLSF